MKKVFALILAAICLLVVGCSGKGSSNQSGLETYEGTDNSTTNISDGNNAISQSLERYYEWEDDRIVGLTEEGKEQKELIIPERCTGFIYGALDNNEKVEQVSFLSDDTELSGGLLAGCTNLREVKLPGNITEIPSSLFSRCSSLETVTIPQGVETIAENAFMCCVSLQEIELPDSLQTIEREAFFRCSAIEKMTFPSSLTYIGAHAFDDCKKLEDITFSEGIQNIDEYAFYNCHKLEEVVLPEGLTRLGGLSFVCCDNLEDIYVPASLNELIVASHDDPLSCVGQAYMANGGNNILVDQEGYRIDFLRIVAIRNDTDDVKNTIACCICCHKGVNKTTGMSFVKVSREDLPLWSDKESGGVRHLFDTYEQIDEDAWRNRLEVLLTNMQKDYTNDGDPQINWFVLNDCDIS